MYFSQFYGASVMDKSKQKPLDISVFDIPLKIFRVNNIYSIMQPSARGEVQEPQQNVSAAVP